MKDQKKNPFRRLRFGRGESEIASLKRELLQKDEEIEALRASILALREEYASGRDLAREQFLANVSHEIRTPISAVMGMNEIILRESMQARDWLPEDGEKVRGIFSDISGYAGIINTAGRNLLAITRQYAEIFLLR